MQNKYNLIAEQDDCATDALPYFESELLKLTGMSMEDLIDKSEYVNDGDMHFEWHYNEFMLEISAEDPYFKLNKLVN